MRRISGTAMALTFLLLGLAAGFLFGRSTGFETGSEWALVQADILAREAGVFMPVYLDDGAFRVVIKQPRGLYKRAWQQADLYEEKMAVRTAKLDPVDQKGATTAGARF